MEICMAMRVRFWICNQTRFVDETSTLVIFAHIRDAHTTSNGDDGRMRAFSCHKVHPKKLSLFEKCQLSN